MNQYNAQPGIEQLDKRLKKDKIQGTPKGIIVNYESPYGGRSELIVTAIFNEKESPIAIYRKLRCGRIERSDWLVGTYLGTDYAVINYPYRFA